MLLLWLMLIPFIGGLLCWQCEFFNIRVSHWIALFAMGTILFLTLLLWYQGGYILNSVQEIPRWQIKFVYPWIPRFGINIRLALDGLSLLMLMLTGLLGILAVLCSWKNKECHQGLFYFNLLWILGSVIGVFLAIDLFLFFFCWEMMLIPMYFLITLWGCESSSSDVRVSAANKFFIYTQTSGLLMLIAIISLVLTYYHNTGIWTFNYEDLLKTSMSNKKEYLLMLGFFLAFAVKMPIVPLHGWLPNAHSQSPTTGSLDLAGILLKTAAYGMLRFSLPLFPHASKQFAPIAMWFGVLGIFYGACAAFLQTNIKKLVSYASISHMGFVLIAIYSGSKLAYQGAVLQMLAHGLSAAGMFIICGQLYERLHTYDMRQMGAIWNRLDFIPALSLFFAAAMLGMPGTGNFIGEITILFGSYSTAPIVTIFSVFGLIFSSLYSLILIQNVYYGTNKSTKLLSNITWLERVIIFSLVILLILLGFFPQPIIDTSTAAINNIQCLFVVDNPFK